MGGFFISVFQRVLSLKGVLVERVVNVVDALGMFYQLYEVEDNVYLQFHQSITHLIHGVIRQFVIEVFIQLRHNLLRLLP